MDDEETWSWISWDKAVKKQIIQEGIRGERPSENSRCTLLFADSTNLEGRIVKIIIGESDKKIERLLERCIATMKVKEVCFVAYEDNRAKIELLGFEKGKQTYELNDYEKAARALEYKTKGAELFKLGYIEDAYSRFLKALKLICFMQNKQMPLYLTICSNIAQCHLSLERLDDTITVCNKVLQNEPLNAKCLLRRASAYQKLRDFEKSYQDFNKVLEIEPNNPTAKAQVHIVKQAIIEMNSRYNVMVKKMFASLN